MAAVSLGSLVAVFSGGGAAAHTLDPSGHTTEEQSIKAGPPLDPAKPGFLTLVAGDPWPRMVRELPGATAQPGRLITRKSLAYFAQLTDFQLADEESPARVEFADKGAASAWRPQEPFHPHAIDYSMRQLNNFTAASPHTQGDGTRVRMDLALVTGDNSDNQQLNETLWVRQLIEGTPLTPNSGIKSAYAECTPDARAALLLKEATGQLPNEPIYTGVADYRDYEPPSTEFYDPNQPAGKWADWPRYQGLLDRAQFPFTPVGLRRGNTRVPTYVSNGNHDGLVQGNEDAVREFEDIATGCRKPFVPTDDTTPREDPDPNRLFTATGGFFVRPDAARRFVDRAELKGVYSAGVQADDHGFAFVDPAENAASRNSATYYSWAPKRGLRFIGIDTVSDGGVVERSSSGNIDHPQWQWLVRRLEAARTAGELVIVFGHHPIRSLTSDVPDEAARPCTVPDAHGHDVNPGCDLDPRPSTPVHLGTGAEGLSSLLSRFPNVLAYVAGHTHENKVLACGSTGGCPAGGNWWEINTSAVADWPQENRLIEAMDNRDGTLSLFGTLLDHAAPLSVPAPSDTEARTNTFTTADLAALGRSFSFNDPQADRNAVGAPQDQNVELLVDDPRR
jgi:metallophosphoesterase (TIGR03767 family)